jgi:pimeloyl-ACP methyl ester carboxylesterase
MQGQLIQLGEGSTYWKREGSLDGTPIVLVHGATVPSWEFDFLVPHLLRAGFQTLRFDLYGHGASDRPRGAYTFERFERQVIEFIERSDFPRPAIFLGHSFGAALVAAVSVARPDWVSRIVLVAPMLDFSSTTAWTRLFRVPALGEIAMHGFGVPSLIRRRKRRYSQFGHPQLMPLFLEQVSTPGYGRALLSMFRTGALGIQGDRYAALRASDADILVITGDEDNIIPPEHIARVRSLLPPHEHRAVPAEHNLLLTHPELVVDALVQPSG